MINWCRQFVKMYPGLVFFMGLMTWALGIGIGFNSKLLVEHDMVPDRLWRFLPLIGVFQVITMLTGLLLFAMSASVAFRSLTDKKKRKPLAVDQTSRNEGDSATP